MLSLMLFFVLFFLLYILINENKRVTFIKILKGDYNEKITFNLNMYNSLEWLR